MNTQRAMSFGTVADDYNRLRPPPPPAAVDWLLPAHAQITVDLAAGTGLLSRALPAARVIAIEPDRRMRAVLRANSPGIDVVAGVGEAMPIISASVDAVLVSSAWHWMDPERAVPEIGRVLRDGGRFGLIWTRPDREVDWIRDVVDAAQSRPRQRNRDVVLPAGHSFTDIETASFTFTRSVPIDDFAPMIGTYSPIITASDQERAEILGRVRAAVRARFPGVAEVDLPMRSLCWRATRAAR